MYGVVHNRISRNSSGDAICMQQHIPNTSWHTTKGENRNDMVTLTTEPDAAQADCSLGHAWHDITKLKANTHSFIVPRRTSAAPSLSGVGPRLSTWRSTPCISLGHTFPPPVDSMTWVLRRGTDNAEVPTFTNDSICERSVSPVPSKCIPWSDGGDPAGKENIRIKRRGVAASSCVVASRKYTPGNLLLPCV